MPICELQPALDAAESNNKLLAHDAELADHFRNLIDRVQLESSGLRVSRNLKRLIAEPIDTHASLTITKFTPMERKRRGVKAD